MIQIVVLFIVEFTPFKVVLNSGITAIEFQNGTLLRLYNAF